MTMDYFDISPGVAEISERAMAGLGKVFAEIDAVAEYNTQKVMAAFQKNRVSDTFFAVTTGYGYGDRGRDALDLIYADIFNTESALVRTGFVNGTHAITAALFASLKPGDTLLSVTGLPYDTLQSAIGIRDGCHGSLKFYGIDYAQVDFAENGLPDYQAISCAAGKENVGAVFIQRSRGYSTRPTLSVDEISKLCGIIREATPRAAIIVDNCYGEFVERTEPTDAGADLVAGSLIKNPGGGLAPAGGYIAGRRDLVENAAMRLTTPGIGGECGASLGVNRALYQGLFLAPHTVAQALKTAVFCAAAMEKLGYETSPASDERRSDIIQMIKFGNPGDLKRFCEGIQKGAPVDSFVTPEPWDMPGYDCQVIMAAGAFVQGASIELSADGPMRPPYCAYLQGGLTFPSGKLGIMLALDRLVNSVDKS